MFGGEKREESFFCFYLDYLDMINILEVNLYLILKKCKRLIKISKINIRI